MECLLTNGECFLINVDMSAKRAQSINVVTNLGGSLVSPEKLIDRKYACRAVANRTCPYKPLPDRRLLSPVRSLSVLFA